MTEAETSAYRQALADVAVVLRVQGLSKLTAAARDGYLSACNSVIDMTTCEADELAEYVTHMRSKVDHEPRRMTLDRGTWSEDPS